MLENVGTARVFIKKYDLRSELNSGIFTYRPIYMYEYFLRKIL